MNLTWTPKPKMVLSAIAAREITSPPPPWRARAQRRHAPRIDAASVRRYERQPARGSLFVGRPEAPLLSVKFAFFFAAK